MISICGAIATRQGVARQGAVAPQTAISGRAIS
jgi:hypothetical protein